MVMSRPVKPRATRSALMVASVPEFTRRTISMEGTHSRMSLGQFDFALGGRAEAGAELHERLATLRSPAGWRGREQRAPGADVVDVFVPIGIVDARALAADHEGGVAADAAEGADGGVDAARDALSGAGEKRFGNWGGVIG